MWEQGLTAYLRYVESRRIDIPRIVRQPSAKGTEPTHFYDIFRLPDILKMIWNILP